MNEQGHLPLIIEKLGAYTELDMHSSQHASLVLMLVIVTDDLYSFSHCPEEWSIVLLCTDSFKYTDCFFNHINIFKAIHNGHMD